MIDRFVAFDLETTGSDLGRDAILEVGAVRVQGERTEVLQEIVRVDRPLPPAIVLLTGITDEMAAGGVEAQAALSRLVAFCADLPLVAHNAAFDVGFLRAYGVRLAQPVYDTLALWRLLEPEAPSHGLDAAAGRLGLAFRHHRAAEDARVTAALFADLLRRLGEAPAEVLQAALDLLAPTGAAEAELLARALRGRSRPQLFVPAPPPVPAAQAPAADVPPLAPAELARLLDPGGPFSRGHPQFEERPAQRRMLEEVARAFAEDKVLVVEAGTGTGKSLAYLVPALHWALTRSERVVVATHTIPLQEQLLGKDLPAIQRALGWPVRAALLKGRGNYLCLWRWREDRERALRQLAPEERAAHARLSFWLARTRTGDRAELGAGAVPSEVWSQVETTSETCLRRHCPFYEEACFYYRARRLAEQAQIVIVNHSLLVADLAAEHKVLPPYERVIVDEAHRLEEVATEQLGPGVDERALRIALHSLQRLLHDQGWEELENAADALPDARSQLQEAQEAIGAFAQACAPLLPAGEEEERPVRITDAVRALPAYLALHEAGARLAAALRACAQGLESLVRQGGADLAPGGAYQGLGTEVTGRAAQLREAAAALGTLLDEGPDDLVVWLERVGRAPRSHARLRGAPLYPGPILRALLFERVKTAVLTSATLAVDGRFSHLVTALGLPEGSRRVEAALPSPYAYRDRCLLAVPTDLADPRDGQAFTEGVVEALEALLAAADGRTLVLFTSHRQLRAAEQRLRPVAERLGLTLLAQGVSGSRTRLVEALRREERTVVFGSASFWEGVDVPGPSLRLVVIVRLPFTPPDRPVLEARAEDLVRRGRSPFRELALPSAVLRFKQGFGRLIRSREDAGAVVVLDPRLAKEAYGRAFLRSLPEPRLLVGPLAELLPAVQAMVRPAGPSRGMAGPAPA